MEYHSEKRIYVVCPVNNVTPQITEYLKNYVSGLEAKGHSVHWPARDTNQTQDLLGRMAQNRDAIKRSNEIHIYWDPASLGSKVDLGMIFMANKPVKLINKEEVEKNPSRSRLEDFLLQFAERNGKITMVID
jgi:hypothetical protein